LKKLLFLIVCFKVYLEILKSGMITQRYINDCHEVRSIYNHRCLELKGAVRLAGPYKKTSGWVRRRQQGEIWTRASTVVFPRKAWARQQKIV
jgi:hypothetical protein